VGGVKGFGRSPVAVLLAGVGAVMVMLVPAGALSAAGPAVPALAARSTGGGPAQALAAAAALPADPTPWTSIGPTPIGAISPFANLEGAGKYGLPLAGRVSALAVSPADPYAALLGSANGGVWRTTDGGEHWKPTGDSLPSLAIGAIAYDPTNSQHVYLGTGEADASEDSYSGDGLWESEDGGATWSAAQPPFSLNGAPVSLAGCEVSAIAVDPTDGHVAVAVEGGASPAGRPCQGPDGIYVSTDGGATFSRMQAGEFSAVVSAPDGATRTWFAGGQGRVVETTDDFTTITFLATGLPAAGQIGRVALAADRNLGRLWVLIANAGSGKLGELAYADAPFTSFVEPPQPASFCTFHDEEDAKPGQCWYDLTIAANPSAPGGVVVGGVHLYIYAPPVAGTYQPPVKVTSGIHPDYHALVFDGLGRLWAGNDGGVFRSPRTRLDKFWSLNATLSTAEFEPGISADATDIVGGLQDNGTVLSSGQQQWTEIGAGDGGATAIGSDPGTIYFSHYDAEILETTDGGTTGVDITPYKPAWMGDKTAFYAPLAMSPSTPTTIYEGTTRLWRSLDGGSSWYPISPQFPSPISSIGLAGDSDSIVYVGLSTNASDVRLERTTDGGATWTNIGAGLPDRRAVTSLLVAPGADNTVYATLGGYCSSSATCSLGRGDIFVSTSAGGAWTDLSRSAGTTLPNASGDAVALDSRTGVLYVGTDVGVFALLPSTHHWETLANGLPHTAVLGLLVDTTTQTLLAATHGRGMYSLPLLSSISLTPDAGTITPAATFTVNGYGFGTDETVDVTMGTTGLGTASTDAAGAFTGQYTVPASTLPGEQTVTAVGASSGSRAQAVFLAGPSTWPEWGQNAGHTNDDPTESVLTAADVASLAPVWSTQAGVTPGMAPAPTVQPVFADGTLFVVSYATTPTTRVYEIDAIDAETGDLLWSTTVDADTFGGMAVANGVVFSTYCPIGVGGGADTGVLQALDEATGATVWTEGVDGCLTPPTVDNGMVFVGYAAFTDGHSQGIVDAYRADDTDGFVWEGATSAKLVDGIAASGESLYVVERTTSDVGRLVVYPEQCASPCVPSDTTTGGDPAAGPVATPDAVFVPQYAPDAQHPPTISVYGPAGDLLGDDALPAACVPTCGEPMIATPSALYVTVFTPGILYATVTALPLTPCGTSCTGGWTSASSACAPWPTIAAGALLYGAEDLCGGLTPTGAAAYDPTTSTSPIWQYHATFGDDDNDIVVAAGTAYVVDDHDVVHALQPTG
jgi:hypothetical protein